jgi:hypothetical protein
MHVSNENLKMPKQKIPKKKQRVAFIGWKREISKLIGCGINYSRHWLSTRLEEGSA